MHAPAVAQAHLTIQDTLSTIGAKATRAVAGKGSAAAVAAGVVPAAIVNAALPAIAAGEEEFEISNLADLGFAAWITSLGSRAAGGASSGRAAAASLELRRPRQRLASSC